MKFKLLIASVAAASLGSFVPAAASAQTGFSISIGSGGYGGQQYGNGGYGYSRHGARH